MNLQTLLDNAIAAQRAEEMKTSPQLTLGELILKLENIRDKTLPIVFDVEPYYPTDIDSWRGSYCELALEYSNKGKPIETDELLEILKRAIGIYFEGYKGGDFLMGKTTPVWVANYGESIGFTLGKYTAVVDVVETENNVVIKTKAIGYLE